MNHPDLNKIIALDKICFPDEAWAENVWIERWNSNSTYFLSHIENGELVGTLIYYNILDEAEILKIFLSPTYRGQGIAGKLIQDLEAQLKERSVQQCFLEVRRDNMAAIKLYKKMGFSEAGCRKNYYRHPTCDALIFSKRLIQ